MNFAKKFVGNKAIVLLVGFFLFFIGLVFFYFFYQEKVWIFPFCVIHQLTGLYCPGCGSTRATYWLLHGDIVKALKYNALYIIALPLMVIFGLNTFIKAFIGKEFIKLPAISRTLLWIIVIVALTFGVLRNIPIKPFNFLAP